MSSSVSFPIPLAVFLTISFALFGRASARLVLGAFVAGAVLRTLLARGSARRT